MVSTQPVTKIVLPKKITFDVLRTDLLKYRNINNLMQKDLAYDIGIFSSDLTHFLAGRRNLPGKAVLLAINLIYL